MAEDPGLMQLMYGIAHAVNSSLDLETIPHSVPHAIWRSLDVRVVVIRPLYAGAGELQVVDSLLHRRFSDAGAAAAVAAILTSGIVLGHA